jgi:hypothetical protein
MVDWAGNFPRSHRGYLWRDPPRIDQSIPADLRYLSRKIGTPTEQLKTDLAHMANYGLVEWVPVPVPDLGRNKDVRGSRAGKKDDSPAEPPDESPAPEDCAPPARADGGGAPVTRITEQRNRGTE